MLELIALAGGLILCFYMPYEAAKVRGGWMRKNFKGAPEEFRAAYLKQLTLMMWIGIAIGAADIAISPLDSGRGEWIVKLLTAAVWLAAAAIAYTLRGRLACPSA